MEERLAKGVKDGPEAQTRKGSTHDLELGLCDTLLVLEVALTLLLRTVSL